MKIFNKLLLAILTSLCLIFVASVNHLAAQHALAYDIVIIGFDQDLGGESSEKIGLLATTDLEEGFVFGIINKLKNGANWESHNNQNFAQLSFKIVPGQRIKKGTLLEVINIAGKVAVKSNGKVVTDQFEIRGNLDSRRKFIEKTGSYLTVHSGYFTSRDKDILLGTMLDVLSIGVSNTTVSKLELPNSFRAKNIFTTYENHHGGGHIDFRDCKLCDLLLIILDPKNWIMFNNSPQDDVDLSDFNIDDCAQTDCFGVLELKIQDCTIFAVDNPCGGEITSYEWQVLTDGVFITLVEAQGSPIKPYDVDPNNGVNGQYRLIVNCASGCVYTELIDVDCIPIECTASLEVDTSGCTMTAIIEGCTTPQLQWYFIGKGGSISQVGNTPTITATKDGEYYAVLTGCAGCDILVSDYITMTDCIDCDCEQDVEVVGCTVIFEEEGCLGYTDVWQYSANSTGPWSTINFHGLSYVATVDGFYRRTLSKECCEDIITVSPEVICATPCDDFIAFPFINQDCEIEISYSGCSEVTDISIGYAVNGTQSNCDASQIYQPGGGYVVDNIDNGLSGLITIDPEFENTCYAVTLTCANGCIVNVYIWNGQCCQGDLMITNTDCVISASNLPCTGDFTYYWIIDGVHQQSYVDDEVPPYTPTENVDHQLEIICADGCVYPSNILNVSCVDPDCGATVEIVPDACVLTAVISNCPTGLIQWQIDEGNGFEDIPGANGQSYLAMSDDPHKVIITNCEYCEDDEVSFIYTPMGCDDMCDCETDVFIDPDDCTLKSVDSDCNNILWMEWWQLADDGVTWYSFPESFNQSAYTPTENGTYKKVINLVDCPPVEDIEVVDCLIDCSPNINIVLEITDDCKLKATWTGCGSYNPDNFGWYWANSTNCSINSDFPTTQPSAGDITNFYNDPLTGTGYLIVDPAFGEGCYFFNFQCDGCTVIQKAIEYEECCPDTPSISESNYNYETCDYCWTYYSPEILNIEVTLPDGTALDLNTVTSTFNFPYCGSSNCTDPNSLPELMEDINNWLGQNGYLGFALLGDGGICRTGAPFHINDSNVEFEIGEYTGTNGNIYTESFVESGCQTIWTYILTVVNECEGASYLWTTGETTESIITDANTQFPVGVTITCPDGCEYFTEYEGQPLIDPTSNLNSLDDQTQPNDQLEILSTANIGEPSFKIYPNPTRDEFSMEIIDAPWAEYMALKIYSIQGQLVRTERHRQQQSKPYQINTAPLAPGLYYVWVEADAVALGSQKLIIIK